MKVKRLILILFLVMNVLVLYCYSRDFKKLSLEHVFKGGLRLAQPLPSILGWQDDTHYIQYSKGKYFNVNATDGESQLMLDYKNSKDLTGNDFYLFLAADHTADFNRFLFVKDGTIFLFAVKENKLEPLVKTNGTPHNPTFSPDGTKIAYTLEGNLFVFDISSRKETQLTRDGSSEILNGYASWIYYEEILGRRSRYRAFR
ncbi:MAG: DPP IV N-terminal domain-containing protein, partial [Candidatus Aminicenantes bacterium]